MATKLRDRLETHFAHKSDANISCFCGILVDVDPPIFLITLS